MIEQAITMFPPLQRGGRGGECRPEVEASASSKNPPVSPLRKGGKFVKLARGLSSG